MLFFLLFSFVIGFFFLPAQAFAWGGITHLEYSQHVLSRMPQVMPALAHLIQKAPQFFLYGSIAADIILVKNLRGYLNNGHNWQVALQIFHKTKKPHLKSLMLGYLSHLAADTVSHNFYVPIQTVNYAQNRFKGHVYWEMLMDLTVTDSIWQKLDEFHQPQFKEADDFLAQNLKQTLLPFHYNKRIFSFLLRLQNIKQYRQKVDQFADRSQTKLKQEEAHFFKNLAKDAVMNFLTKFEDAAILKLDPTGRENLKKASRVKKQIKKLGRSGIVHEAAEIRQIKKQFFDEALFSFQKIQSQPIFRFKNV